MKRIHISDTLDKNNPTCDLKKKNLFFKSQELKRNLRFLCSISGGQDSILKFFLLLHKFKIDHPNNKQNEFFEKVLNLPKNNFTQKSFYSSKLSSLTLFNCHHFWQRKNFICSSFTFRLSFLFYCPYALLLPTILPLTENRSRQWRKKMFLRFSKLQQISYILTGHTQTDRVEKNLLNVFRGTGSRGISGLLFFPFKKTSNFYFSPFILKKIKYLNTRKFLFEAQKLQNHWLIFLNPKKKQKPQDYYLKQSFKHSKRFYFSKAATREFDQIQPLVFSSLQVVPNFSVGFPDFDLVSKSQVFGSEMNVKCLIKKKKFLEKFTKINSGIDTTSSSFNFYSKACEMNLRTFKPIQSLTRFTLSKLVKAYQLPIINDLTNFSLLFSRAKIRHQILPVIRSLFHKKLDSSLLHFFKIVEKDCNTLEKQNLVFYFLITILQGSSIKTKKVLHDKAFRLSKSLIFNILKKTNDANLESAFFQKLLLNYLDREVNFLQLSKIQNQLVEKILRVNNINL